MFRVIFFTLHGPLKPLRVEVYVRKQEKKRLSFVNNQQNQSHERKFIFT